MTEPKVSVLYAGAARNKGIEIAQGKYLSFLDSDDIFEPDMLEEAYKKAEKVNADIVVFGAEYIFDELRIVGTTADYYYNQYAYNQYTKIMSLYLRYIMSL